MTEPGEDIAMQQGLTLEFNQIHDEGQVHRLISLLDTIFALGIFEKTPDIREIENIEGQKTLLYSNPFVQLCKENYSFLGKYLNMTKLNEGLDYTLTAFGKHQESLLSRKMYESHYKNLKVTGNKDKLVIRVAYVLKTDNYSSNLRKLLKEHKGKHLSIKKCTICSSSEIVIKNQNSIPDLKIYDGSQDRVELEEILMNNRDESDLRLYF